MATIRAILLDKLTEGVTTADLERISKTFPHLLTEALREVNGEIQYGPITEGDGCYDDGR